MSSNLPHYISIKQASDKTGLSYYYLRQLVLDNKVEHINSGVKYLINEDALSEYLLNSEKGVIDNEI